MPCSENEELEEVASADLRYLAVPALLGALTLRQVDASRRREHLEAARAHFCRFLQLCRAYGLSAAPPPAHTAGPGAEEEEEKAKEAGSTGARGPTAQRSLLAMAAGRQAKIER